MRTILIDDEPLALESLEHDIVNYCPELEIIGTYLDPEEAITAIDDMKPDLVMTDIQMPRMNAFTMIDQLKWRSFDLLLVTAYNKYAVKAFEFSAVDYILKPIDPIKLVNSVNKVKASRKSQDIEEKLSLIMHNLKFGKENNYTLAIPTSEGVEFVEIENIIHLRAETNYCSIFFNDNTKLMVSKPLKHFCDILCDHNFLRIHQSHMVNTKYIKSYRKGAAGSLVLKDGTNLPISRSQKPLVSKFLFGE